MKLSHLTSPCIQRNSSDVENPGSIIGIEDCLHLIVWSPSLDTTARLPVMFWISVSVSVPSRFYTSHADADNGSGTSMTHLQLFYILHVETYMYKDKTTATCSSFKLHFNVCLSYIQRGLSTKPTYSTYHVRYFAFLVMIHVLAKAQEDELYFPCKGRRGVAAYLKRRDCQASHKCVTVLFL
ncbi:hypothetical protein MAR_037878 [Mya arenaria]|uniref:Uncharacterized protein n=1 Tax=Mya arenaria TaxID=6604 RepID=A0ABY7FSE7_MYAAR|nr:hypothetical protein MAR_037878 [Mya arenaria]